MNEKRTIGKFQKRVELLTVDTNLIRIFVTYVNYVSQGNQSNIHTQISLGYPVFFLFKIYSGLVYTNILE